MPTESPNTLRSRARFKIIDLLGIGQIGGLYNGAKSVFFDGTPVMNEDGTLNFPNFDAARDLQQLLGESSQGYLPGFNSSESETSVGVKVTKDSPEGSGSGDGSVTRTITDSDVDAVRVTLRIPALTTTNTTTGDITGGKIQFKIEVRESGGSYVPIPAGQSWADNATPSGSTPDGTLGLDLTVQTAAHTQGTLQFQYRKYDAGTSTWGSWTDYGTATEITKAAGKNTKEWSKSVTGLSSGIYQARAQLTNALGTSTQTATLLKYLSSAVIEINGKTTSPYDAAYRVELPEGGAPWDVKVSRISSDNTAANIQDDLYWYSYTEIIDNKFSMPNCAAIGINLNAEDFGGNLPQRDYEVLGRNTIKIPDNYDPIERTYTGTWTGTFTTGWTNNPAWIFYDLLVNKLYGLGNRISEDQIDRYALYEIAQYCDELVDTVDGEQEPRYTINCVINTQEEAYELLNSIASAFRGMIYWANGSITAVADMPTDAMIDVGPANVIDGVFTYQGAAQKARHTVARVSWNNPDDGYKLNVELYEDEDAIRLYGYRPIDVNAYGCVSRGLARRWGKWIIASDLDTTDVVTYKASFDHFMKDGQAVRPGHVIRVYDPEYSGVQLFGRVLSIEDNGSAYEITLDRDVTFPAGVPGTCYIPLPSGEIKEVSCGSALLETKNTITVAYASLPVLPSAGATWAIKFSTVEPRLFKVFAVTEPEPNIYQVSATFYDPDKFDKVESDLNFEPADYTAYPSGELAAPTGVNHSEFLKQSGASIISCVALSWTRPNDPRAELFEVEYQIDGYDWQKPDKILTSETNIDILNTIVDTYNFRVRTLDSTGLFKSSWTYYSSVSLLGKTKAPEDVTGFTASVEKFGILLEWNPVSDLDIDFYEIRSGASWAAGTTIAKVNAANFKYEDAATGAYTFWIKAVDTTGNPSANEATASATVSTQGTPTVTATAVNGGIQLTIGGTTSRGFKAYEIQRKEYPSGTETTINSNVLTKIWTDSDIAALGYSTYWQYRVRVIDQNGDYSAWSSLSTQVAAKQIETTDITANQIIAKDFRTACNAGNGTVSGVLFNANGIQAWNGATNTFCIDAATGNVSMTGTITATAGSIGGWSIYQTGIYKYTSDGRCGIHLDSNTPGMCIFDKNGGGHTTIGYISGGRFGFQLCDWNTGYNFFEASNCCTHIAGWNFNSACLYSGNIIINSSGAIQGNYTAGSAGWCIDCAGNAAFHSGCIGGWSINATNILKCPQTGSLIGLYTSLCSYPTIVVAGCLAGSTYLTLGGSIFNGSWQCNKWGLNIRVASQNIFSAFSSPDGSNLCAQIAGWRFNSSQLYSTSCCLILCSEGSLQSGDFVASNKGWKICCNGNAEFNNICARGAIRTAVFIKDEISVVGGCTMIRPAGVFSQDDYMCSGGNYYYIDDVTQFAINDIVRVKADLNDYWGKVYGCCTGRLTVCWLSGSCSGEAITKGQAIVNYGSCLGCGGIMLNGQCPYIDLYTHNGCPWCGTCSRVRIGNLDGWGSFSGATYGIAMGTTCNYMSYDTASGNLVVCGDIYANNGIFNGTVCSCAGCIGGWGISSAAINYTCSDGGGIVSGVTLTSGNCAYIRVMGHGNGSNYMTMGGSHFCGTWIYNRWGIHIRAGSSNLFTVWSCPDGTCVCAQIAKWNFNCQCLYSGALILNSAGSITGNYTACSAGWCISCTGAAEFNNVTVRGTVCACAGCIGCFCICNGGLCVAASSDSFVGFHLSYNLGASMYLTPSISWRSCNDGYYNKQAVDGVGSISYTMTSSTYGCRNDTIYSYNYFCISQRIYGSSTGICSLIFGSAYRSGSSASNASFCICTYGGTSCYAFCTNGRIQANGVICTSDRNLKTDLQNVSVLQYLRQMPITKWRFCDGQDYHIGPMAQDFNCIFQLAHDWRTNKTVGGLDGIALKGVQELDECVAYNNRRIGKLEAENAAIKAKIAAMECQLSELKAMVN